MGNVALHIKINNKWDYLDLDKSSAFALNYKQSELTNPTAVKVPYSVQISIPKTKHNNVVFSCIGIKSTAARFNPLSITNFRLFVNGGLFQSGYMELEEVDIENDGYFKIRLYGGLGNFFFELNNIKLYDLNPDQYTHDLNNKEVANLLTSDNGLYGYALTYQGFYENFDNDRIDNGIELEDAYWQGGAKYLTNELNEHARTELDYSGEYRSYYQKPVLKLKPLIEAIRQKMLEKNDVTIDLDEDFFNDNNPYYGDLWLLSNNYNIGDGYTGYGLIEQFGDTEGDTSGASADEVVGITENQGKKFVDLGTIDTDIDEYTGINIGIGTIISKAIPVSEGDSIKVKLVLNIFATNRDPANSSHYLYKSTDLTTQLRIVDGNGNPLTSATPMPDLPSTSVAARSFSDIQRRTGNLERKRPADSDGFGKGKNFGYDYSAGGAVDDGTEQNRKTEWEYYVETPIGAGVDIVYVQFVASGDTYWKQNSNSTDRQYGVAFRVLNSSKIQVVKNASGDDEENIIEEGVRSDSTVSLINMVNQDTTCFDLLISYCKLFGLILYQDIINNKIWIGLRENYYKNESGNYEVIDWTQSVDRNKEFKIQPLALNFRRGVFRYNSLDTKYENRYNSTNKIPYGGFEADNGYILGTEEYNYLDGTIFDNCIVARDYSKFYRGRYNGFLDNKELPHLQTADGNPVELNGYIPLFRGTMPLNDKIRVTDDTDVMEQYGSVCWNNNSNAEKFTLVSGEIAGYYRTIETDEVYSLNFGRPSAVYSESEALQEKDKNCGIYARYWRSYLNDRLSAECKILVCHVFIRPTDIQGDLLSKFIYIDGAIWVIDEIFNYNPISEGPTKVKLIKVKDINNYLDRTNVSDMFTVSYNGETVFENGGTPKVVITDSDTATLTIESSVDWFASNGDSGKSGEAVDITVNVPTVITFNYGQTVDIEVIKRTLVNVTATGTNGATVTINGKPSPQQIAIGSTAQFNAVGSTQFFYWEINRVRYTSNPATIRITEATTATANYLGSNQVRLYSDDPYTTITGVEKTGNYWTLNVGTSYTFNNSQGNFSGFLFSGDTTYTTTGSRTIKATDGYLNVYYNQALFNLTVVNNSPLHIFYGDQIYIETTSFDFEVQPNTTDTFNVNMDLGTIEFNRLPYHYPTFSQTSFTSPGVYNLTITGNRVGWDGDVEENIDAGYQEITRTCYSPIPFTLTSNVAISPTSGNGQTAVDITLQGYGGEVVQNVGDFQYTLKLNQDVGELNLGWTEERLIIYEDTVSNEGTTYIIDFYNSGFPIMLGNGLTQTAQGDGYVTLLAEFEANTNTTERQLIFVVTANNTAYQLILTQDGETAVQIGWVPGYLPVIQATVSFDTTTYANNFIHNYYPYTLSEGLTSSNDFLGAFLATATFEENPTAQPRTLTFYVICNGQSFQMIITQEGDPDKTDLPIGIIVMWSGSSANIPEGWALCDGGSGTPNLIDRFVLGGSSAGATGGVEKNTLEQGVTIDTYNLPNREYLTTADGLHSHTYTEWQVGSNDLDRFTNQSNTDSPTRLSRTTSENGIHQHGFQLNTQQQEPLQVMPPYYQLCFIMKIS